ncbi:MAG: disulfide bond formation protein B [Gemmatimonadota bacterium]
MNLYPTVIMTLGFFGIVVFVGGVALLVGLAAPGPRARLAHSFRGQERHPVTWAAILATTAMAASLYLSEVIGLIPCSFCWYQRFAMYPLALILIGAAVTNRPGVWRIGLPLSTIGLAIAIYHVTIQWMPTLDVGACSSGAPCTGRYVAVFGFISIPTMAGAVFTAVLALMVLLWIAERNGPSTAAASDATT